MIPMPEEDQAALHFLAEHSIDVICRAGPELLLQSVSPSSLRLLGFTPDEMIGKKLEAFVSPEDASSLTHHNHADPGQPLTVRMQKKDGTILWAQIKLGSPEYNHPPQRNPSSSSTTSLNSRTSKIA